MSEEFGQIHTELITELGGKSDPDYLGAFKRRLVRLTDSSLYRYVGVLPKLCTDFDSGINVALLLEIQPDTEMSIIVGQTGNIVGYTQTMAECFEFLENYQLRPLSDFSANLMETALSQISEQLNFSKVDSFERLGKEINRTQQGYKSQTLSLKICQEEQSRVWLSIGNQEEHETNNSNRILVSLQYDLTTI